MFTINLKRSVVTLGVVAGLLAAAGPASAQIAPASISIGTTEVFELNTVRAGAPAVAGLKAGSNEVLMETVTLAHERDPSYRPQASTVERLAVIYDVPPAVVADSGRGDDTITQAREPAHTVTMIDYMGTP